MKPDGCYKVLKDFRGKGYHQNRGFIMPDGETIDIGHHQHVDIAWSNKIQDEDKAYRFLDDFMKKCHAMTFHVLKFSDKKKILSVNSFKKPTSKQVEKINHIIPYVDAFEPFSDYYDPQKPDGCYMKINHPRPLDVQRWISRCWQ